MTELKIRQTMTFTIEGERELVAKICERVVIAASTIITEHNVKYRFTGCGEWMDDHGNVLTANDIRQALTAT